MTPTSSMEPPNPLLEMHGLLGKTPSYSPFVVDKRTFENSSSHDWKAERRSPKACHISSPLRVAADGQLDVTIYVGKNRTPYVQSSLSLKGSSYFRSLLERRSLDSSSAVMPIVVDCEQCVFQNMMTLLRYGSFEALPKMSEFEMFKLRKELEFYGIEIAESPSANKVTLGSTNSSNSPPASSPSASRVSSPHFSLSELPDFPADLADPARLVLVSCLDDEDLRSRCPCVTDEKPNQWALSFQHRHAFCTGCGTPPLSMPPKFLAELFMVGASYYSGSEINRKKWFVGTDSTCTLKFLSANACCSCACGTHTVWAVSTYHFHAFCTQCRKAAEGSALVCILLTLRYKSPKSPNRGYKSPHFISISRPN